jgi:hypothetical protein
MQDFQLVTGISRVLCSELILVIIIYAFFLINEKVNGLKIKVLPKFGVQQKVEE